MIQTSAEHLFGVLNPGDCTPQWNPQCALNEVCMYMSCNCIRNIMHLLQTTMTFHCMLKFHLLVVGFLWYLGLLNCSLNFKQVAKDSVEMAPCIDIKESKIVVLQRALLVEYLL